MNEGLANARALIESRYFEPLDVRSLACAAQLSQAHFIREFHRAYGAPPHQFLIACRMEHAAARLRNGHDGIAEVCRAVGLRSVGSFTTRFTATFGVPPARYRDAHTPQARR